MLWKGRHWLPSKNDFGWDFLANDLAEDCVATRPGGLRLDDHSLGLPPVRPPGDWSVFFLINVTPL